MKQAFQMRPIFDVLLYGSRAVPIGLYHLQIATADQLCRLHYSPGSIKAVKARLKLLVDHGYIQADRIPTKAAKSPYYYTLAKQGMSYLTKMGFEAQESWREQKEVNKHGMFLEHTLELNDILISAALLHQTDQRYRLYDLTHERNLKRHPIKIFSKGVTVEGHHVPEQVYSLIPDAFLDFSVVGTAKHFRLLLEHDRGTEGQDFFRKRIRAYVGLLTNDNYRQFFAIEKLSVVFTTFVGEQRLKKMRQWTESELQFTKTPWEIGSLFAFTALPREIQPRKVWLEPVWHYAYAARSETFSFLD